MTTRFIANQMEASNLPQNIPLTEHDRTMRRMADEIAMLRQERVDIVRLLDAFRAAPVSVSSLQPILNLADRLCGPVE